HPRLELLDAEVVLLQRDLDLARLVLDVAEGEPAELAPQHDPAGEVDDLAVRLGRGLGGARVDGVAAGRAVVVGPFGERRGVLGVGSGGVGHRLRPTGTPPTAPNRRGQQRPPSGGPAWTHSAAMPVGAVATVVVVAGAVIAVVPSPVAPLAGSGSAGATEGRN